MFNKIKNIFINWFKSEEPVNEAVATVEVPRVIIEERKVEQKPAPKKQPGKKPQSKKPQVRNKKG